MAISILNQQEIDILFLKGKFREAERMVGPFYFVSAENLKNRTIQAMEFKNKCSTLYDKKIWLLTELFYLGKRIV